MNPKIRLLAVVLTSMGLHTGVVLADDSASKTGQPLTFEQKCAANPKKCEEVKARMQERCAQDPKRCEEFKARQAERKAKCEANPEACKKKAEDMRAHRQECRENPKKCQRQNRDDAPANGSPK
jgi:hypothetical protein